MKVTYYFASSLDGFIANKDGEVSWLDNLGISMDETGYDEFFDSVDALVMGRETYEFVYNYGSWPYGDKPAWVCTSRELDVMKGCNLQKGSSPLEVKKAAEAQEIEHLWLVGGGRLAASFIENKMLTHLSISQMPVILGGGIRFLADLEAPVGVKRQHIEPKKSGFTQLEFEIDYS